jgi:hypothetical protein
VTAWYEQLRAQYRPDRLQVLLIGESPPDPGAGQRRFFYAPTLQIDNLYGRRPALYGDHPEVELTDKPAVLRRLQANRFWLIDAVDQPINQLRRGRGEPPLPPRYPSWRRAAARWLHGAGSSSATACSTSWPHPACVMPGCGCCMTSRYHSPRQTGGPTSSHDFAGRSPDLRPAAWLILRARPARQPRDEGAVSTPHPQPRPIQFREALIHLPHDKRADRTDRSK